MKIGVYGGTFNPVHNGHIHIVNEFILRLKLQKVLLIPAAAPPHKSTELANEQDRFAMCRLAACELKNVDVSDLEIRRGGKSYTVDTLKILKRECPGDDLFLLMGEDMFLTLSSWYRAKDIFDMAVMCASPRSKDGYGKLLNHARILSSHGASCAVETIEFLNISSTMIRERLKAGEDVSRWVDSRVLEYIISNGIYQ